MKRLLFIIVWMLVMTANVSASRLSEGRTDKHWTTNPGLYGSTMTVIGVIHLNGAELRSDTYEIGAFNGEVCRGSEILNYYPAVDKYLAFFTIYGEDGDEVSFRLYSHEDDYEYIEATITDISFEEDAIIGLPSNPYVFDYTCPVYTVMCESNAESNGLVSGGGTFFKGQSCTVEAVPIGEYQFLKWTENGVQVSQNAIYSFSVETNHNLMAHFHRQVSVIATVSPAGSGTTMGGGIYYDGDLVQLSASPANRYVFANWTENGQVVSTQSTMSFIADYDRHLVANFYLDLPELHVTSISHSDFIAGQQATVSWVVSNDGNGPTPNGEVWYDRVWLSVESRVAADDNFPILLGEFPNVAALGPGESYSQTQSFNIPLTLSGPYYLFVITDAYDCHHIYWENGEVPMPYSPPPFVASESAHCSGSNCGNGSGNRVLEAMEYLHGGTSYHNNFFYEYLTIEVPPLADLQVTSILAPNTIYSGTTAQVVATVTNNGEAITNVSRWSDALYYSQSDTFDPSTAQYIGSVQHADFLNPGESYQVILTGTIPLTIYGEVYFYVHTDFYGQVYEHVANDNNVSRSEAVNVVLSPPADLIPLEIVIPSIVSTGQNLAISYTVYNQGAGNPDVSSWCDKVYLSTSPDGLESPIELKTINHYNGLASDATYTVNESIALPSSLGIGAYYVYVVVDANGQVFEYAFEDNNTLRSISALTVVKPDLAVTQIITENTLTSCYPASFSYTLKNVGEGQIADVSITDKLYVSTHSDMSGATLLTTISHTLSLTAQQSITFNVSLQVPNLGEDTYYLFVLTDVNHALNESNEENNSLSFHPLSILHQPLPDLTPTTFDIPSEIQAGSTVVVEFDVANIGEVNLININSSMEVYAVQNNQQILCPVQSQEVPASGNISILVNGTLHYRRTILVPATVTSSCNSFFVKVDDNNKVVELDESNNTYSVNAVVIDCPLPDLTVDNFSLPGSLQAGGEFTVSFDVENEGDAAMDAIVVNVAVYANWNGSLVLCPLRNQSHPAQGASFGLEIGESIHFEQIVLLPPMIDPTCTEIVVNVDPNNAILENNEENNSATATATMVAYPFDLELQSIEAPAEITAGQTCTVSWTVKNDGSCPNEAIPMFVNLNGTYHQAQSDILPYPWVDKVYFSLDDQLSDDDVCVTTQDRTLVLNPDNSYTMSCSVLAPYSVVGDSYLIAVTDCTDKTYDINRSNNTSTMQVTVLLGELPDLRISVFEVNPVLTADQTYTLNYTVVNEGDGATTLSQWKDAFYIGQVVNLVSGSLRLAECTHQGTLEVGESYSSSVEVTIPSSLSGDFYIIGFTDATSVVYEHDNESNNVFSVPVSISLPLPCDLTVVDPSYPASIVSGDEVTISWTLVNVGHNPATGRIRDAVYLSSDDEWSSDDIMLGYEETYINIAADGQLDCRLSAVVQGISQGDYHIIIKSNILRALNEATYDNNVCIGQELMNVDYPLLAIGSSVDRTMTDTQYLYYKIEVGPEFEHQTLLCQLTTTASYPGNGLYIAYESAPSMSMFDFSSNVPYAETLEILIPSLQCGNYYLLARGSAQDGQSQDVTISASIINFEILHVDADHGSNTGSLTTQVLGAKFDSIMDFRLVQGEEYFPAEKVFFSNTTESFVTFNLKDLQTGLYDVVAELPTGLVTVKDGAFTVEEGLPAELTVNIISPSSVRYGNTFTVNIEYGNIGSTDLNVSALVVVSQNGHPIALESDELHENKMMLQFETAEPNGNPDVLRPGSRGTRTIFVKASNTSSVRLGVFAIRNYY